MADDLFRPPEEGPEPGSTGERRLNARLSRSGAAPSAYDDRGLMSALMGELVKSYGFKQDAVSGDWGWSAGNIVQSFKDDPVWTAIDWISIGVPAGKFAQAGKLAKTFGVSKASTLARPARGRVARAFENPQKFRLADEYAAPGGLARARLDPTDVYGLGQAHRNEFLAARASVQDQRARTIRQFGKAELDIPQQEGVMRRLTDAATDPFDPAQATALRAKLGETGAAAFTKTWGVRNQVHDDLFALDFISAQTHAAGYRQHAPRVYQEFLDAEAKAAAAAGRPVGAGSDLSTKAINISKGHLKKRTYKTIDDARAAGLVDVLDPRVTVDRLAGLQNLITREKFLRRVATDSAVSKGAPDLATYFLNHADAAPGVRAAIGLSDDVLAEMRGLPAGFTEEHLAPILDKAGWVRMEEVASTLPQGGNLANRFAGKWVQKGVVEDITGYNRFMAPAEGGGAMSAFVRLNERMSSWFRWSKTVANPATHGRNYMGGMFFNWFGTGTPTFIPVKAIQSIRNEDALFKAAHEAGVFGTDFASKEIRDVLNKVLFPLAAKPPGIKNAFDWLTDSEFVKLMRRSNESATAAYQLSDDIWKLNIFSHHYGRFQKAGMSAAEAGAQASLQVAKFTPNYLRTSSAGEMLRPFIPFSSFTMEAMRIARNTMIEHPVRFFGAVHFAEASGRMMGAAAGMSQEEIDTAASQLPNFAKNRKMTMLPFKVDGKPSFLDLSYIMPMGNIAEGADAEKLFFGGGLDPSANPIVNVLAAATTNVDPFTRREIAPRFTERYVGAVEGERTRKLVGMAEHMATLMAPPLLPPGYAAQNLLELVRQERNPSTGALLEPDTAKTLVANIAGLRTYEGSVNSQLLNVKDEERQIEERMGRWRDRWKAGFVNSDTEGMETALNNMRALRDQLDPATTEAYIANFVKDSEPGQFRGISNRQLQATLEKAAKLNGQLGDEDRQMLSALYARAQEREARHRSKPRKRAPQKKKEE